MIEGRAIQKRNQESMYQTDTKKLSKEVKRKVGRATTKSGAIKKITLLLSLYRYTKCTILIFRAPIIYL